MSISDEIIVLNKGSVQQKGVPQDVYNKPDNLFVSKFLGNPPINIFNGIIQKGELIVDGNKVTNVSLKDQEVIVGVRPEDFMVDENGFEVDVYDVETIGRDVIAHFILGGVDTRALIRSDHNVKTGKIRLGVKSGKIHIFTPEAGELVNA